MPVIAAVGIAAGLIEASAVVTGIAYVAAGLYVAGKATGNADLVKLGDVAGLVAGGMGIYDSFSEAANLANTAATASQSFPVDESLAGTAADVAAPTTTGMFNNASQSFPVDDAASFSSPAAADAVGSPAATTVGEPAAATVGEAAPVTNPTAPDASALPGTPDAAPTTTTPPPLSTTPNPPGSGPVDPNAPVAPWSPPPQGNGMLTTDANANIPMPTGVGADPSMIDKAKAWWGTLSEAEKLMVGNFVAKGFGSIGDFVGPKADLVKAQAGMATANTALTSQQTANISQPISKLPASQYTFTPKSGG